MEFEWGEAKADGNARKHRVTFAEAQTVFDDPMARIFDDPDHSLVEHREIVVGHSAHGPLLVVCFTERYESVRIVSARAATRTERNDYEENS